MKNYILSGLLALFVTGNCVAQSNALYDDSRVSSIYITINPDSLAVIYDSVLSDHYYMARFIFDDNEKRDTLENIGFRLRGNTSRYSKKKSFKISFNEYVSGRKYQGVKKINLNGEHNDPTMIREKLFYDIWKKAGMVERRTSFVKVFINGTYYGLYTNLEEMEKEWLTRVYSKTGGNLFKCTYPADLVYHGPNQQTYKELENGTSTGGRVYDLQTNKSADDYARLVQLITVLNQQPVGTFPQEISEILNVDHFLKALALDVATGNWDNYSYNKNNFYLYDNPFDSTYDFITYDPDNTFGVDWFGIDWGTRDCLNWINNTMPLPLAQKVLAIPAYFNKYRLYLDTIANTVINPDSIFPHVDAIKQLIQQAAIADTYRTLDYGYTVSDFNNAFTQSTGDHVTYGLKPFLTARKKAILQQLNPGGVNFIGKSIQEITLFPNPATDNITLVFPDHWSKTGSATVFNLYGDKLMTFNLAKSPDLLSITHLPAGLYLIRVQASGMVYQARFIKR